ncbi:MAG: hypothetical protein GYB67_01665 [Chloroflexi bacterium]|nr:hypothetical protein [Chloroflexota bacterium]
MPKVKIVWFVEAQTARIEQELEELLNDGWWIVTAGGGGDAPEYIEGRQTMFRPIGLGFIVLQKDDATGADADAGSGEVRPLRRRLESSGRSESEADETGG